MEKIQKFIWDMIKALFGLFILTFMYVLFFSEADTNNTEPIKKEDIISMDEAIKILDDKNVTRPKEKEDDTCNPAIVARAENIMKNMKNLYDIKIVEEKERYFHNNYYQFDSKDEAIEKRVTVTLVGHTTEALTNPDLHDNPIYFYTCNSILMSLLKAQPLEKEKYQNTLLQMFGEVAKASSGTKLSWDIENVEVTIKPDSTGILGCQFYKNLKDD